MPTSSRIHALITEEVTLRRCEEQFHRDADAAGVDVYAPEPRPPRHGVDGWELISFDDVPENLASPQVQVLVYEHPVLGLCEVERRVHTEATMDALRKADALLAKYDHEE